MKRLIISVLAFLMSIPNIGASLGKGQVALEPSFITSDETIIESENCVIKEVEGLREKNSETYLLSDGSFECIVYPQDKLYKLP